MSRGVRLDTRHGTAERALSPALEVLVAGGRRKGRLWAGLPSGTVRSRAGAMRAASGLDLGYGGKIVFGGCPARSRLDTDDGSDWKDAVAARNIGSATP